MGKDCLHRELIWEWEDFVEGEHKYGAWQCQNCDKALYVWDREDEHPAHSKEEIAELEAQLAEKDAAKEKGGYLYCIICDKDLFHHKEGCALAALEENNG